MKIPILITIDPPSAERCRVEFEPNHWRCCDRYDVTLMPSPSDDIRWCSMFRRNIGEDGARLPECIAATERARSLAAGVLAAVEEIARGLTTTGVLPAPKIDRVATDPVIALREMEIRDANR